MRPGARPACPAPADTDRPTTRTRVLTRSLRRRGRATTPRHRAATRRRLPYATTADRRAAAGPRSWQPSAGHRCGPAAGLTTRRPATRVRAAASTRASIRSATRRRSARPAGRASVGGPGGPVGRPRCRSRLRSGGTRRSRWTRWTRWTGWSRATGGPGGPTARAARARSRQQEGSSPQPDPRRVLGRDHADRSAGGRHDLLLGIDSDADRAAAAAVDHDLLLQRPRDGDRRQGEPGDRPAGPDPDGRAARGDRDRGLDVLLEHRRRLQGHRPSVRQQRHRRRDAGRIDDHAAVRPRHREPDLLAVVHPKAPRDRHRDQAAQHHVEERHPRAAT